MAINRSNGLSKLVGIHPPKKNMAKVVDGGLTNKNSDFEAAKIYVWLTERGKNDVNLCNDKSN